ncbi:MAG: hypothetical protein V9G12_09565 [Microthrixaceae bacterium]
MPAFTGFTSLNFAYQPITKALEMTFSFSRMSATSSKLEPAGISIDATFGPCSPDGFIWRVAHTRTPATRMPTTANRATIVTAMGEPRRDVRGTRS